MNIVASVLYLYYCHLLPFTLQTDTPAPNGVESLAAQREQELASRALAMQPGSGFAPGADITDPFNGPKGALLLWEPMPSVFPSGMERWQGSLPLALHNRYFDRYNNYSKDFTFLYQDGELNCVHIIRFCSSCISRMHPILCLFKATP